MMLMGLTFLMLIITPVLFLTLMVPIPFDPHPHHWSDSIPYYSWVLYSVIGLLAIADSLQALPWLKTNISLMKKSEPLSLAFVVLHTPLYLNVDRFAILMGKKMLQCAPSPQDDVWCKLTLPQLKDTPTPLKDTLYFSLRALLISPLIALCMFVTMALMASAMCLIFIPFLEKFIHFMYREIKALFMTPKPSLAIVSGSPSTVEDADALTRQKLLAKKDLFLNQLVDEASDVYVKAEQKLLDEQTAPTFKKSKPPKA